ncbi:MAG: M48 family metalloprotease [Alphaproteobacteria bacterium]|nr:M48 family metalloprotease [Alphaproteobacteria bacterium]
MNEWFTPIFEVNNMSPDQVKIILVQSSQVNAFVAGGANIFFFTGLIEKTENPGELIGVMAHELGHVSGGHLVRGRKALEQASYESILGTIIGIGTAIATGDSKAAGAGSIAGSSVAGRRFLAKTRTFESSADQAALTSMKRAGMNPSGLLTFLQKLEGEEFLPATQQSEYVRSHPLTRNRISTMETRVVESELKNKDFPPRWLDQHARMKAKLVGFIHPERVSWNYDIKDKSVPALYARAIAAYRQNKLDDSITLIDQLLAKEPENPYFHELKGQVLVDFGKIAQGRQSYQKAAKLLPNAGLILMSLAHAQIESAQNDPKTLNMAIRNLKKALQTEPHSTRIHRLLATAYGRTGQDALAQLHLAEEALLQNKKHYAKQKAEMALKSLKNNQAATLRAQDILQIIENKKVK